MLYEIWSLGHKPFESKSTDDVGFYVRLNLFNDNNVCVDDKTGVFWTSATSSTRLS